MQKLNHWGFLLSLGFLFLLPIFFIPTQYIPLGLAKIILIVTVTLVLFAIILSKIIKEKKFVSPNTLLLWGALSLPIIYIISGVASSTPTLSIFGYAIEPGTTGSIVFLSILFFAFASIFRDRSKLIASLTALFVSLSVVAVFVIMKILTHGSFLTLGVFFGSVGNSVGSWTDLVAVFGLLNLLTIFATEMLPLSRRIRALLYTFYILSLILICIVNFSTVWILLIGSAIVLLVYFATIERVDGRKFLKRSGVIMALVLLFFGLIFSFNPKVGSTDISTKISNLTGVSNADVRPNLRSTLSVSKDVLAKDPILGSGPNTFDKDWLLYKSQDINASPFWNIAFPFGYGFLPTALSTVGVLGGLAWLSFLVLFIILGFKSVSRVIESRSDRFILTSTFLISLYLWIATFIYSPSIVILTLAFIFSGIFVGASQTIGVIESKEIILNKNKFVLFGSYLSIFIIIVGVALVGFVSVKKIIAAEHFQKALVYSNTQGKTLDQIESELGKAITISPSDPFWNAVSQVELARANSAANNTSGSASENQTVFQNALAASIAAMQNAIKLNPTYQNWVALGNIYDSLVPAPLSVNGAYESANVAYNSAQSLNPLSPEVSLLKAKLELDHKNIQSARDLAGQALSRKQDYADAYFFIAQLEISQNNLSAAIKSAETGALLSPGNPGVFFQLGLLKYSNHDYIGAVDALNKALSLVPDYANAEYYLGLSLDKLGKESDALAQFEALAKTNPDNSAVNQAITNLKAGRSALSDSSQTSKTNPPIKGQ